MGAWYELEDEQLTTVKWSEYRYFEDFQSLEPNTYYIGKKS
jgi:hypothetical protein